MAGRYCGRYTYDDAGTKERVSAERVSCDKSVLVIAAVHVGVSEENED